MGSTLRALRALVLLSGFYLLGLGMLVLLAGIDWAATLWTPAAAYLKLYVVTALLAIPVVRGMFMLRTPKGEPVTGLRVTASDEPELWRTVRELAEQVGTRAPDEIILTGDVNASVSEDARLLGLLPGPRTLCLGLPLMTGLDEAQLRAVLAHELGHYSNADTRLAAITVRGRVQVLRTVAHFEEQSAGKQAKEKAKLEKKSAKAVAKGKKAKSTDTSASHAGVTYRAMARIYTAYAKLYIRATLSGSRRQEFAADLASARIAGRDATASALREIPVLDSAHDFYLRSYATLGTGAGLLPPPGEVFGGLRHLLAGRTAELDELRAALPEEERSPYDSHPPIAERVARIEALPDDGRGTSVPRPTSLNLFRDPARTLVDLEAVVLTEEARGMRRAADWESLVHDSMTAYFAEEAAALRRAASEAAGGDGSPASAAPPAPPASLASLASILDAIDGGELWQIAARLPQSDEARSATGRAASEFARPAVRRGLSRLATGVLLADGRARWHLSWSDAARLELPPGYEDLLPAALDAAVADRPDTDQLRKLVLT